MRLTDWRLSPVIVISWPRPQRPCGWPAHETPATFGGPGISAPPGPCAAAAGAAASAQSAASAGIRVACRIRVLFIWLCLRGELTGSRFFSVRGGPERAASPRN